MILGFLGKGGSGKSTVSTLMARFLHAQGMDVLAVDADHNMDLAYNLEYKGYGPFMGGTFLPLRNQFGLNDTEPTENIFVKDVPGHRFSFTKQDEYSQSYVHKLQDRLYLLAAGPQSDNVLYGSHCSHSLAAPLKVYLPLLHLSENEAVVVDEKASVDAVSTGIPSGFDLAVVVAEPRIHSLRAAKQIADMLDWYEVPRIIILNKSKSQEDQQAFYEVFEHKPFAVLEADLDPLANPESSNDAMQMIINHAKMALVD